MYQVWGIISESQILGSQAKFIILMKLTQKIALI